MLAHTFGEDTIINNTISGWFLSEKLDGLRAYWDGGISRGFLAKNVPYANTERDKRLVDPDYLATGLWSRNAKVIRAPEWFLDALPNGLALDGELWGGVGQWEATASIIKQNTPDDRDWRRIKYMVFDSPLYEIIFQPGLIETEIYTKLFDGDTLWWINNPIIHNNINNITPPSRVFEYLLSWLKKQGIENDYVHILEQTQLPYANSEIISDIINGKMEESRY